MLSKEDRINELTEQILKHTPRLHKFFAAQLATAWIENPEEMTRIMKEDMKLEKAGKKPPPRSFLPVYDAIKVTTTSE